MLGIDFTSAGLELLQGCQACEVDQVVTADPSEADIQAPQGSQGIEAEEIWKSMI